MGEGFVLNIIFGHATNGSSPNFASDYQVNLSE